MFRNFALRRILTACLAVLLFTGSLRAAPLPKATLDQIAAIEADKAARTPAQRKLDSRLIYGARTVRGQAAVKGVPGLRAGLALRGGNVVEVDIAGVVNNALLTKILNSGGQIVSSFPADNAIRATLPIASVETIAARSDVQFIEPALRPRLHQQTR